jgi:hypothetical protein
MSFVPLIDSGRVYTRRDMSHSGQRIVAFADCKRDRKTIVVRLSALRLCYANDEQQEDTTGNKTHIREANQYVH